MSANTWADIPTILLSLVLPSGDGPMAAYEAEFAAVLGGGRAVSFSAGRVALAAILDAFSIGAGDEVIIPGYTCVAVPNPIIFSGARPVYADIQPDTLNLDPEDVARKITAATRAIVVQHTFGLPEPLEPFRKLADRHGLKIIEDCTHALGARYGGELVGTQGDAAFFSSEQTKIISTGAGGVAYSRDGETASRLVNFQARCIRPSVGQERRMLVYLAYLAALQGPVSSRWGDPIGYYLSRLGLMHGPVTTDEEMACRLPDVFYQRFSSGQARVALAQLRRFSRNLARRHAIAMEYVRILAPAGVRYFPPQDGCEANYVRWPLWVDDKAAFSRFMREHGVQVGVWFTAPVHPLGVPQINAGYEAGRCPAAESAVAQVANLPCHPRMSLGDAGYVARLVMAYHDQAGHKPAGQAPVNKGEPCGG
ncbi:MAG: DegT/DnrJ/EryC1/StrS family aminotransferase [Rhodocyclaceae bacterium]|nr:DegT/DnrJ/EryC1/StrS family aminotransferase [Rhodocyclaceae bacterium]